MLERGGGKGTEIVQPEWAGQLQLSFLAPPDLQLPKRGFFFFFLIACVFPAQFSPIQDFRFPFKEAERKTLITQLQLLQSFGGLSGASSRTRAAAARVSQASESRCRLFLFFLPFPPSLLSMERSGGEEDPDPAALPPGARLVLSAKEFLRSRKGLLLLAQAVLSFLIFICYIASSAASFLMVPLLTFLLALCLFFVYALKINEKFKAVYWLLADFICGIIAAIIYFAISIAAVSKYSDSASKTAGVFGFIATIVYCVYVYLTFNGLMTHLKQEDTSATPEPQKSDDDVSDSDSD
uniref:CKLF like MARVEL transmembrane domain containing 3 n=1 Tax=Salvator merianae TaxID=96440 RepID=A0A8D0BXJ6_SALMN